MLDTGDLLGMALEDILLPIILFTDACVWLYMGEIWRWEHLKDKRLSCMFGYVHFLLFAHSPLLSSPLLPSAIQSNPIQPETLLNLPGG